MSLGIPLAAVPAVAQDDEGELAPVVITGSNIPTVELEGPSPIVRIDREEINRSGAETVGELLRRLPQNNSGSYDEKFQNSFAPGTSGVSLRGMGMSYTLVLVDGRRLGNYSMAQNITDSFSDLNGVPMALVERVEVLLDGASAIYGSDAVAGVINIITRDNFEGVEINVGYSNPTDSDMGTQRYSITGGTTGENGNAWVSVDYMQRNSLQHDDRDYSASANYKPKGVDFRSSSGNPGSIKLFGGTEEAPSPFDSGFYTIPTNSMGNPTAEEIVGTLSIVDNLGSDGLPDGTTRRVWSGAGINRFDYNPWMTLTPEFERIGAASRVNYTLTDYATAFVHTSYRNIKTHQEMAPTPAFGDIYGYNIPATNPFNPFDEEVSMRHRLIEVGPRISDINSDIFRVLPGVKFDIGDTWQAETAFLYNKVETVDFGSNYVSADALNEALASSDPATAYNPFGAGLGINSPSVLDGLRVNTVRRAESELRMFDVKAAGDLAELPGGTLALAVGAETAKEEVSDVGDSLSMANKIVGSGGTSNAGGRSRDAGYAEFMIPVIGEDNRIPGIHSLGVQAAWRVEHYSDFGSDDNPKVGVKYSPIERVLLRATYQTAFKAPSLQELYMGQSYSHEFLVDPARGDDDMQYEVVGGGNPDLKPESADSISIGAVINIPMPENMDLSMSVNWSQVELEDQVAGVGAQYMLSNEELFRNNIIRNPQTDADKAADNPGPDGFFGTEDHPEWGEDDIPNGGVPGTIKQIKNSYLNLAEVDVEVLDISIDYGIDTSMGYFSVDLRAAYMDRHEFKSRPTDDWDDRASSYTFPEWRGNVSLWWNYDKYSAGATINYVDSFDQLYGFVSEVDDHTTLDLQASYDLTDNSRITVGALNVTDEDPPWSDSETEGYSYQTAGHNPWGTVLYARATVRF
ncbi:MAG: TonB-dependent receptor [Verrucomicrobiota bacterium]|nr:TonB-dependent receptor [Verrucomicrobiota bacterium]